MAEYLLRDSVDKWILKFRIDFSLIVNNIYFLLKTVFKKLHGLC